MSKKSPQLRFEGFTDDWEESKLGKVFDTITDYVANGSFESLRKNVNSSDINGFAYLVRLQDASNNWQGPWLYTDQHGYEFLKKSKLQPDDIIMANVGSVGKFFLVPKLDKPMTLAPNAVLIKSSENDQGFLYQMMLTPEMQYKIFEKTTPGVQSKINKTDFKMIETRLPNIEEQHKIGSFFKQLDDTIALHQHKLDLLKEQKKGFLQKMFPKNGAKVPELRFAGFADDWEERKLKDIFDVHTDFVSNGSFQALKENVQLYKTENYAYMIRLQDASNNWDGPWLYTDKQGFDFLDKSTVYKDDILMSDRGTIGKFFLVPQLDKPMTLSSNAVLLRSTKNDNNFIYYMLNTSNISNQIIVRTTPGVQPMISKTEFKKINTCIPNIEEQQKIGSFFKQVDDTIALHQRKLDLLKEQKKGLLQKMFV